MPKQFKTARQINKLKVIEAAEKLGISQPTLSAWEGERKSPSIDSLENMANLYGVTTDFLLGRSDNQRTDPKDPPDKPPTTLLHPQCRTASASKSSFSDKSAGPKYRI